MLDVSMLDVGRWTLEVDVGHGTLDIRMLGVESWTIGNSLNVSCCMLHVGRQNVGRQTQDVQHSDVGLLTLDVERWTFGSLMLDLGNWTLDFGPLTFGRWELDVDVHMFLVGCCPLHTQHVGRWTLEVGRWKLGVGHAGHIGHVGRWDIRTFGRWLGL